MGLRVYETALVLEVAGKNLLDRLKRTHNSSTEGGS